MPGLPRQERTTTQHYRFESDTAEGLKAKFPAGVMMLPGTTGRVEVRAKRVVGVCTSYLGAAMRAPVAGSRWAEALAPAGMRITRRGGFNGPAGFDCDAYVEFVYPAPVAQGAQMGIGPLALIGIGVAIGVALGPLRWLFSKLLAILAVVVGLGAGPGKDDLFGGIGLLLIVGLVAYLLMKRQGRAT